MRFLQNQLSFFFFFSPLYTFDFDRCVLKLMDSPVQAKTTSIFIYSILFWISESKCFITDPASTSSSTRRWYMQAETGAHEDHFHSSGIPLQRKLNSQGNVNKYLCWLFLNREIPGHSQWFSPLFTPIVPTQTLEALHSTLLRDHSSSNEQERSYGFRQIEPKINFSTMCNRISNFHILHPGRRYKHAWSLRWIAFPSSRLGIAWFVHMI